MDMSSAYLSKVAWRVNSVMSFQAKSCSGSAIMLSLLSLVLPQMLLLYFCERSFFTPIIPPTINDAIIMNIMLVEPLKVTELAQQFF